jgi:hypothetical protein
VPTCATLDAVSVSVLLVLVLSSLGVVSAAVIIVVIFILIEAAIDVEVIVQRMAYDSALRRGEGKLRARGTRRGRRHGWTRWRHLDVKEGCARRRMGRHHPHGEEGTRRRRRCERRTNVDSG